MGKGQEVVLQLGGASGANNPSNVKNKTVTKHLTEPRTWTDSLDKRPMLRNMDMRFSM
jgi:hypothetical protein